MSRLPVLSMIPMVSLLVLACADVGGGEDTNPFGDGTAATGTDTEPSSPTSGEASTAGTGEATSMPTTEPATTEAPTTEASTSGPPPDTDDATSTPGDSSGGGSGEGEIGDCVGIGAWESCAQYCEAVLDVCVEGGCGGSTVVYYGDIADCMDMVGGSGEATPCAESFAMGGGASFARCCCA